MHSARGLRDTPSTTTPGRFEPSVRHVVKYPSEFRSARAYATMIRTRQDWEKGDWRRLDPDLAATRYQPSTMELYAWWPARDVFLGPQATRPRRSLRVPISDGRCHTSGARPNRIHWTTGLVPHG